MAGHLGPSRRELISLAAASEDFAADEVDLEQFTIKVGMLLVSWCSQWRNCCLYRRAGCCLLCAGHFLTFLSLPCMQGTSQSLEKSYFRLTAAPDPASVRPEPVRQSVLPRLCRTSQRTRLLAQQCRCVRAHESWCLRQVLNAALARLLRLIRSGEVKYLYMLDQFKVGGPLYCKLARETVSCKVFVPVGRGHAHHQMCILALAPHRSHSARL